MPSRPPGGRAFGSRGGAGVGDGTVAGRGGVTTALELDGKALATINGALVVLAHWPFEGATARGIAAGVEVEAVERLSDAFSEMTRRHFMACGVWEGPSPWTAAFMAQRAATRLGVRLTAGEWAIIEGALRASVVEFELRWWEFCLVAPGGLDLYGVEPWDVVALIERLEAAGVGRCGLCAGEG